MVQSWKRSQFDEGKIRIFRFSALIIFLIFSLSLACAKITFAMKETGAVREPAVADQFYPGDPGQLSKMVDSMLAGAQKVKSEGELVALIAPHAGYVFSGPVAAHAYKQIEGMPIKTVILVGLAHSYPVSGGAVWPQGAFRSPLGDVSVDEDTVKRLIARSPDIRALEAAHANEHSLETQIPFLQRTLRNFQIVPIVMGNPDLATAERIGNAIADVIRENEKSGKRTIVVASTDMAHYPDAAHANESDQMILKTIEALDPERLIEKTKEIISEGIPEMHVTLCGEGATLAVMAAAKALGVSRGVILKHATSADSPLGDRSRAVGYGAVSFSRLKEAPKLYGLANAEPMISPDKQKQLLLLARHAVQDYLANPKKTKSIPFTEPDFMNPAAVFVTLTKAGGLRGCIGTTEPEMPLGVAVQRYAIAAAVEDPRFSPVQLDELPLLSIEISILSHPKTIKSHEEIVPDRDGVIVERNGRRGLFLPQVWEHFPGNKEKFMNLLCSEKAGLPADCWKNPSTRLSTFTVFSFQESN